MDLVSSVMAYESGEMTQDDVVEFFQGLVDSGMAWDLQGSYGRAAMDLMAAGEVTYDWDKLPPRAQSYMRYLGVERPSAQDEKMMGKSLAERFASVAPKPGRE